MPLLSLASHLGSLLLPHDAFQEHAAHPPEWSGELGSKGSESTCILPGLATFLHCAFTAHPDLVVDHWTSDVESSSPLDFRLLHAMWTPFGCLMSYEIRPIISVACDFTTKSGGIWVFSLSSKATNKVPAVVLSGTLPVAGVVIGFLLHSDRSRVMEKKLTNSGPLREPADKHSIYTMNKAPCGRTLRTSAPSSGTGSLRT